MSERPTVGFVEHDRLSRADQLVRTAASVEGVNRENLLFEAHVLCNLDIARSLRRLARAVERSS